MNDTTFDDGSRLKPDALPMDDDRYRIPGTNMFSMSRWARENLIRPEPKFKVGDRVLFTVEAEITDIREDCDGSTLYRADMVEGNWSEDCFTLLPPEDDEAVSNE